MKRKKITVNHFNKQDTFYFYRDLHMWNLPDPKESEEQRAEDRLIGYEQGKELIEIRIAYKSWSNYRNTDDIASVRFAKGPKGEHFLQVYFDNYEAYAKVQSSNLFNQKIWEF